MKNLEDAIKAGRAWFVRPGESGENWDAMKSGGLVSVGFLPIDLRKYYNQKGEYKDGKLKSKTNGIDKEIDRLLPTKGQDNKKWYKPGSRNRRQKVSKTEIELHNFARVQDGDIIIAHASTRFAKSTVIFGIGEVHGNYSFKLTGDSMASGSKHHHSHKVDWFDTTEKQIDSLPPKAGVKTTGTIAPVRQLDLSWLTNRKINHWLFIVDDPNWAIVEKENIWDSKANLDTLNNKIKQGDKAIFYVTGRKSFKKSKNAKNFVASFEITSRWIDKTGTPSRWPGPEQFSTSNRITLKPIANGRVPLDAFKKTSIYKKELRKINREKVSKKEKEKRISRILGRKTQQTGMIAGNDATPLPKADYDLIVNQMKKNNTSGPSGITELAEQTSISKEVISEIDEELKDQKQIIFVGPPGTSKTFFAQEFAKFFTGDEKNVEIIQFHPSYNYEDFVEGIRPKIDDSKKKVTEFWIKPGILKQLVKKCEDGEKHVLIIDEINRGNIARIFGELIYLLEHRDEDIQLTYSSDEKFKLPSNLYIIGTMNTADRSIGTVDYALRRRFTWFEFGADPQILEKVLNKSGMPPRHVKKISDLMKDVNSQIENSEVGKDCQIGQTYFMKKDMTEKKMKKIFERKILPLLKEYYFANNAKITDIKEIFRKFKLAP